MEAADPKKASAHQLYFGYPLEHVALLEKYRAEPVPPTPGCYTDYFGIRTRMSLVGFETTEWFENNSGMLPYPDDSYHAETIEYLACARAVDSCAGRLMVAEFGAGWGPWITVCAVMGLRRGIRDIDLLAVEADRSKLDYMRTHLTENGLPYDSEVRHPSGASIRMRCIHAGIAARAGTVSFGASDARDWGGAIAETSARRDYRGMALSMATIPAITIADALRDAGTVDILHVDIQGAERTAIPAGIDALDRQVRCLALGTHSRPIEGEMVELLAGRGWTLEYEKPCKMTFKPGVSIEGMTFLDGLQFWLNPRLAR